MTSPSVVYVMPDKAGGLLNINASLIEQRAGGAMAQHVVLTRNVLDPDAQFDGVIAAQSVLRVEYALPVENLHAVLARLWRAIPDGPGVFVANDLIELAALHLHDPQRAVVQIVHGDYDYYYDLAERHQTVVDVFVAYSRTVADTLRQRLPARAQDILHLPYGIPLPSGTRVPNEGPLRLVFVGRLDRAKGVLDLPAIDSALTSRGTQAEWTIIGAGPAEAELRAKWHAQRRVNWLGQLSTSEVLRRVPQFDVLVLPTHAEGLPLVIVEVMSAGVVPVTSSLTSIAEVVTDGVTGRLVGAGDVNAFAAAVESLDRDRPQLERMSRAAQSAVANRFDAAESAASFRALFEQWESRRRPRPRRLPLPYGSRLDQPWLPNAAVRTVRTTLRRLAQR